MKHNTCLLKQSLAQSLHDCLNVVCHARTVSTYLVSNCSIASNALRHHAFALRRNHSTHILQGCVFVLNLTKRNNDTKTTGKHRINDTNTTLSKVVPTLSCAPTLRQSVPSVHIVSSQWGHLWETSFLFSTLRDSLSSWHIIWHHPANSGSNILKAVSVPNTRDLQACCKFCNHVAEINHR